ncbi:MAG: T6SS effector amidase Tae4 family protein [Massilia sp.]
MIKPPYAVLRRNYPDRRSVSSDELYMWIGQPELAKKLGWENTCALRMSLGLVRSGVHVSPARLLVRAGECKGRMLEPGQANLSRFLERAWGVPEKYKGGPAAAKGIGSRHGVISFYRLWGETDRQGHIDLVAPDRYGLVCEEDCYWSSVDVWFWPLK